MKNSELESKGKGSRKGRDFDVGNNLNVLANVALCLVGLSVPCFVFDAFWWGVAALAVAGVIILAITVVFLFTAVLAAKALKNIPHR